MPLAQLPAFAAALSRRWAEADQAQARAGAGAGTAPPAAASTSAGPGSLPLGAGSLEAGQRGDARERVQAYVVCRRGNSSQRAVVALREAGFLAVDLVGGLEAWAREVDPSFPIY